VKKEMLMSKQGFKVDYITIVKVKGVFYVKGFDLDSEKKVVLEQKFMNPQHLSDYIKAKAYLLWNSEEEQEIKEVWK
jgi:hypothetical protein